MKKCLLNCQVLNDKELENVSAGSISGFLAGVGVGTTWAELSNSRKKNGISTIGLLARIAVSSIALSLIEDAIFGSKNEPNNQAPVGTQKVNQV